MQPGIVTKDLFKAAMKQVREKKNSVALPMIRVDFFTEGKAPQIMHIEPFSEEGSPVEKVHAIIEENGRQRAGKPHGIYFSDIRRAAAEKWKTIIRQSMS